MGPSTHHLQTPGMCHSDGRDYCHIFTATCINCPHHSADCTNINLTPVYSKLLKRLHVNLAVGSLVRPQDTLVVWMSYANQLQKAKHFRKMFIFATCSGHHGRFERHSFQYCSFHTNDLMSLDLQWPERVPAFEHWDSAVVP